MAVLLLALLPAVGVAAPLGTDAALVGFSSTSTSLIFMAYHLVWALAVLAALTTARMPPGHIPLWLYSREPGDQAYFHNVLQAVEKKLDGSLRFCRKCGAFKPDLAHHSRELGLCILCYQHWDLWSNNAIGFYNYKAYLLSLLYGVLAHGVGCALLLPGVLRAWPQADASYALLAMWMGGVSTQPVAATAMPTSHAHEPFTRAIHTSHAHEPFIRAMHMSHPHEPCTRTRCGLAAYTPSHRPTSVRSDARMSPPVLLPANRRPLPSADLRASACWEAP